MFTTSKKSVKIFFALLVMIVPLIFTGAGTAAADAGPPSILVDARPCDSSDPTPQIRLVLGPGAVVCYGGYHGVIRVDDLYATGLSSGGYWGYVTCNQPPNYPQDLFRPNEFVRLDCPVMWIGITGPDWKP